MAGVAGPALRPTHRTVAPVPSAPTDESATVDSVPRLALSVREVAQALGVSSRYVRDQCHDLPRIRRGGRLLFPVATTQAWLLQQAQVRPDE